MNPSPRFRYDRQRTYLEGRSTVGGCGMRLTECVLGRFWTFRVMVSNGSFDNRFGYGSYGNFGPGSLMWKWFVTVYYSFAIFPYPVFIHPNI